MRSRGIYLLSVRQEQMRNRKIFLLSLAAILLVAGLTVLV